MSHKRPEGSLIFQSQKMLQIDWDVSWPCWSITMFVYVRTPNKLKDVPKLAATKIFLPKYATGDT